MDSNKIRYFIPKVKNRIASEKNRLWKYCNVEKISMCGYHGFTDVQKFKARLQEMLGRYDAKLLDGITEDDRRNIIESAEKALRHEFDLLGSGPVTLEPIDWHIDWKSGYRWNKTYYRELSTAKGADIKIPWELSRCQHLLWLGEAYLITKEEKFAQEIVDEISWWIDDNPLMYSVNWKCTMDVAFRAVNWMYALNMISEYAGFDDGFTEKVSQSLWKHGFYIVNNLEREIPYSNNHYASDIVGQLYIGTLYNHTRRGSTWLRFAREEYNKETRQQVLETGVHYEKSNSYHRMMTEMLSYSVYMLKRIGQDVPEDIMAAIRKMYAYVSMYTKPNGKAPLVADNDDGRFAPFLRRDFQRHGYLNESDSVENRMVAAGMAPLFCTERQEEEKHYEDAGIAIVRREDDYLLINNSGYSKRPKENDRVIPSHTHNDLLSFELSFGGKDLLTDAGTYLYTSSMEDRNAFRSTAKHNTVMVDNEEQNGLGRSFSLERNVHIGQLEKKGAGAYEGSYTTIMGKMYHRRTFNMKKDRLVVTDELKKNVGKHTAKLYLHFAKGLEPLVKGYHLIAVGDVLIDFNVPPKEITINDDEHSPTYGVKQRTKTAIVTFEFEYTLSVKTTIGRYERTERV